MPWLETNTFHHSSFENLADLCSKKKRSDLTISVCLPSLNEEDSIGKVVSTLKKHLLDQHQLIDEIVVIDSGSTDNTEQEVKKAGADFFYSGDILPSEGFRKGKGENLWKAIHQLKGDIICYIDSDISNIHPRFVYGLVGPLIMQKELSYIKSCYERPLKWSDHTEQYGGGRVTEILVRPLFSLFFPELTQLMQPLSGEYAVRRELLEELSFPIGYGVETSHLLDVYLKYGMNVLAQTDLHQRIHRHQSTITLGKMSHEILQTFLSRLQAHKIASFNCELASSYLFPRNIDGDFSQLKENVTLEERPPMRGIQAYKTRSNKSSGSL